ncbi:MAG: MBOAT family O-acyltransferase [Erysipelotrichaceae bacterium]|nr:MBOAT family O-acyltransferase [Erysipelotrichaceae bacterium]
MRKVLLVIANSFFYLSFGVHGFIYLLLITIVSYLAAKNKRINLLCTTILICLFGLVVTKYFSQTFNIIVPVGISFFTFKIVGYLFDVKNEKYEPVCNFFDYYNYVFFFAQITSGPIERCNRFIAQLNALNRQLSYEQLKSGFVIFGMGLFEKMIISARLSEVANNIFARADELYGVYMLVGILAYGMQLYTDFDSYSNIAIGLAKMLGIDTCRNFNVPYLAHNLSDFWRRWHISLSSWLKDYLYIPLGGNRKGSYRKYLNIMIVSLVSGIWHGNTANFIMWGFLHGIGQIGANIYHTRITNKLNIDNKFIKLLYKLLAIVVTFGFVNVAWLFFRLDFNIAVDYLQHLFVFEGWELVLSNIGISYFDWIMLWLLLAFVFVSDLFRYFTNGIDDFNRMPFIVRWAVYLGIVFVFVMLFPYDGGYVSDFIYSNF